MKRTVTVVGMLMLLVSTGVWAAAPMGDIQVNGTAYVGTISLGYNKTWDGNVYVLRDASGNMTFKDGYIASPLTLKEIHDGLGGESTHARQHDILSNLDHTMTAWSTLASDATSITAVANSTAGYVWIANGPAALPSWQAQSAITHDNLGGLGVGHTTANPHPEYPLKSLMTAAYDFYVATSSGVVAKKTRVQTQEILASVTPTVDWIPLADGSHKLDIGWLPTADSVVDSDDTHVPTNAAVFSFVSGGGDWLLRDGTNSPTTGDMTFGYPIRSTDTMVILPGNDTIALSTSTVTTGYKAELPGAWRAHQYRATGNQSWSMVTPTLQYKLNETTGNTAADSSGNGLTGTVSGNYTWGVGAGKVSGCILVGDAVGGATITAADSPLLSATSISLAFWLKVSGTSYSSFRISKGGIYPVPPEYQLGFYSDFRPFLQVRDTTLNGYQFWKGVGSQPLFDGYWHHVVVTFDGSVASFVIDGGSVSTTLASESGTFTQMRDTATTFWVSHSELATYIIDDVRFYQSALTLAQARLLYNSGTGTETLTPSPPAGVGEWAYYADAGSMVIKDFAGTTSVVTHDTTGTLVSTSVLSYSNLPIATVSNGDATHVTTPDGVYDWGVATFLSLNTGGTVLNNVTVQAAAPTLTIQADGETGSGITTLKFVPALTGNAVISYGTEASEKTLTFTSLHTGGGNSVVLGAHGEVRFPAYTTAGVLVNDASGNVTTGGNLTFTGGSDIRPTANSTAAINIAQADGTDFVVIDSTNKRVGVGGTLVPAHTITATSPDNTKQAGLYHNNTTGYLDAPGGWCVRNTTTDGIGYLYLQGNGTGYGELRIYDNDRAEYAVLQMVNSNFVFNTAGTSPGFLGFQYNADTGCDVNCFRGSAEGETRVFEISGYRTGDAKRTLSVGVGTAAANTVSFTGLTNYAFTGTMKVSGDYNTYAAPGGDCYTTSLTLATAGNLVQGTTIRIAGTTGNATLGTITSEAKPVMVWAGGTAATADPPINPVAGWVYLDTDNWSYVYTGSAWLKLGNIVGPS